MGRLASRSSSAASEFNGDSDWQELTSDVIVVPDEARSITITAGKRRDPAVVDYDVIWVEVVNAP